MMAVKVLNLGCAIVLDIAKNMDDVVVIEIMLGSKDIKNRDFVGTFVVGDRFY